jgi:ATP-dependent Zn protease
MSDKAGLLQISGDAWINASPATKSLVESEVSALLAESYARTTKLLKSKEAELHKLANALIDCIFS